MREDPLRVACRNRLQTNSCPDVKGEIQWEDHEKGSAEKCLNLEKHQNPDGFFAKIY
jgi:hypothetical protein